MIFPFGYHTLEDWFGPRYVRLVAQFILNSAKVAEQKGYKVSKEEALADLMQHASISYQQNANNPNLGVANLQQYFDEQLRRMNMDQNKAVKFGVMCCFSAAFSMISGMLWSLIP